MVMLLLSIYSFLKTKFTLMTQRWKSGTYFKSQITKAIFSSDNLLNCTLKNSITDAFEDKFSITLAVLVSRTLPE